MTIQMKVTEHYSVLWYTINYAEQVVSTFRVCVSSPIALLFKWRLLYKHLFAVILLILIIMLYKVPLTYESVDEILWCDHSNETCWALLCRGTVYYAVQGESNFWTIQINATEHFFDVMLFIMMNKVVLTFESVNEIV